MNCGFPAILTPRTVNETNVPFLPLKLTLLMKRLKKVGTCPTLLNMTNKDTLSNP